MQRTVFIIFVTLLLADVAALQTAEDAERDRFAAPHLAAVVSRTQKFPHHDYVYQSELFAAQRTIAALMDQLSSDKLEETTLDHALKSERSLHQELARQTAAQNEAHNEVFAERALKRSTRTADAEAEAKLQKEFVTVAQVELEKKGLASNTSLRIQQLQVLLAKESVMQTNLWSNASGEVAKEQHLEVQLVEDRKSEDQMRKSTVVATAQNKNLRGDLVHTQSVEAKERLQSATVTRELQDEIDAQVKVTAKAEKDMAALQAKFDAMRKVSVAQQKSDAEATAALKAQLDNATQLSTDLREQLADVASTIRGQSALTMQASLDGRQLRSKLRATANSTSTMKAELAAQRRLFYALGPRNERDLAATAVNQKVVQARRSRIEGMAEQRKLLANTSAALAVTLKAQRKQVRVVMAVNAEMKAMLADKANATVELAHSGASAQEQLAKRETIGASLRRQLAGSSQTLLKSRVLGAAGEQEASLRRSQYDKAATSAVLLRKELAVAAEALSELRAKATLDAAQHWWR